MLVSLGSNHLSAPPSDVYRRLACEARFLGGLLRQGDPLALEYLEPMEVVLQFTRQHWPYVGSIAHWEECYQAYRARDGYRLECVADALDVLAANLGPARVEYLSEPVTA